MIQIHIIKPEIIAPKFSAQIGKYNDFPHVAKNHSSHLLLSCIGRKPIFLTPRGVKVVLDKFRLGFE